jgi:hypothetical protein
MYNALLIATNLDTIGTSVLMLIEFSQEQLFHFVGMGIESQPSFIVRVYDPGLVNPRSLEPSPD